jgi:16S rRNA (adenine1518-N6/adenine1519-N6)-dimethyltransferase
MNYNSITEIKSLLEHRGLTLKKRWGQNFLVSEPVRQKLAALIDPQPHEIIWEIGAGIGSLTQEFIGKSKQLVLFELDYGLVAILEDTFAETPAVTIVPGDFLQTWKKEYDSSGVPDKMVGNLPYSSGSTILITLIKNDCLCSKSVFTLQREMVERMTAHPGTKNYSLFTVICQTAFTVVSHGDIGSGAFYPRPQVVSRIVECIPNPLLREVRDRSVFFELVELAFLSRRKTVVNNLLGKGRFRTLSRERISSIFEESGLDPRGRAELIPPEKMVELANRFSLQNL